MNSQTANRQLHILSRLDYGLLLALVLPLFAIMPLLTHAGLPNTADGPVHLMRQVELNQAWQQGNFYPRWGTDLALGHGMPIFSYAPPALYQLTQIFHLSGLPLDESMKAVIILDFLLYSGGMFLFIRRVYGPAPALVAAAVYVYAPYRLREVYIQGNYGQFTGLAFYPLVFWAFHGLITDGRTRYRVAAAVSLAGLLLSHNISSMLLAPMLAVYLLFLPGLMAWIKLRIPPFIRVVVAGLLGLGLAAIFWLPAFGESHQIKLEGITRGFFDFRENFIPLSELLSPPLPLDLSAINPEFPLSLGLPQIIGAMAAILGLGFLVLRRGSWRIIRSARQRISEAANQPVNPQPATPDSQSVFRFAHSLFFVIFLPLYAFLALPHSQGLWETIPLLELAEFPWRMLGPAIFCASVLSAAAFWLFTYHPLRIPHLAPRAIRIILLLVVVATITLNAYYLYPVQFIAWGTPSPTDAFAYEMTSGAIGTTSTGEFLPRYAQQHPRPETLWPDYAAGRLPQKIDPASLPEGARVEILDHLAEADAWQIDTPQEFLVTLRTLYWPGWRLYLDGQPQTFTVIENTGLMQTMVPAGQHTLTLQLESTPLRTTGRWLTIGSVLVLIVMMGLAIKKRGSESTSRQVGEAAGQKSEIISPLFFAITVVLLIALYLFSRPLASLFTLQSDPNRPQPADRILQVNFADQMRLVGMDALPEVVRPGDTLLVTVYWRALPDLDNNYSVFLHLDTLDGRSWATADEDSPEHIPTHNWPTTMYLRNRLALDVPVDLPPLRYDVNVGVYRRDTGERLEIWPDGATNFRLGSVWVESSTPDLPDTPVARFGPDITLWQTDFSDGNLVLIWQAAQPLAQNYVIFVHLLDAEGKLLAQADGVPYAGLYPLPHWRPGQVITDTRSLAALLPDDGQFEAIAIGIYNPATGERLAAATATGNSLPNDSFILPVTP
ncbi:MAG: hypothetical protein JXM69_11330 [Anaerolineae bacterium]|nr:hypothetical protein [Anaerolineae bacterium]